MTGWWRRNAVAIGALVVLTPVTFGAITWDNWQNYYLYRNVIPVDVADDGTIDFAGATWGPIRASEITDLSGFDMPSGAKLLAAAIPVDPDGDVVSCVDPTLVQQITGIRYPQVRDQLGIPYSSDEPTSCDPLEESGRLPYELIVPFVVPEDAEGPFWVEVVSSSEVPFVLRFSIDP